MDGCKCKREGGVRVFDGDGRTVVGDGAGAGWVGGWVDEG